ncbi:hypothetical protein AB1J88_29445 [Pseudomonas sp. S8]|uniref:hypothetical protein n=1 Tax=Pseudomonas sp. S8 TaxID=211136 RepID=UPI003D2C6B3F
MRRSPPRNSGITIKEIKLSADEMPFVEYLQALQPNVIHMHYWGDCDEPWYDQTMRAAQQLGIPVIQNINTPRCALLVALHQALRIRQ